MREEKSISQKINSDTTSMNRTPPRRRVHTSKCSGDLREQSVSIRGWVGLYIIGFGYSPRFTLGGLIRDGAIFLLLCVAQLLVISGDWMVVVVMLMSGLSLGQGLAVHLIQGVIDERVQLLVQQLVVLD